MSSACIFCARWESCWPMAWSSFGAATPAFVKAQTILARSFELKSWILETALSSMAEKRSGAPKSALAKPHAAFAKSSASNIGILCIDMVATASKRIGASTRAVANAQMSKARSAALKPASLSGLKTSFSAAANNAGETRPAVAYAAKMREIIWVWKVGILDGASKAIALKRSRCDSAGPAVENVHAMEARFWALNSFTRSSATAATASKSRGEATPAFENAQTVLVRFWALNVVIFRTASCATA
mmetsp:Transcript_18752/g.64479  ORF Transcript_18752/g.64479 Transcript_18752/m.64479 type:complete len:245 (-) Transcript_18752:1176-1910(-)